MNLPAAGDKYDKDNEQSARRAIQDADQQNVKKNAELNPARLVLTDTVTGTRYLITMTSGVLTQTAI